MGARALQHSSLRIFSCGSSFFLDRGPHRRMLLPANPPRCNYLKSFNHLYFPFASRASVDFPHQTLPYRDSTFLFWGSFPGCLAEAILSSPLLSPCQERRVGFLFFFSPRLGDLNFVYSFAFWLAVFSSEWFFFGCLLLFGKWRPSRCWVSLAVLSRGRSTH